MPTWAENTYSALWTRQFAFEKRIMLVHNDATGDGTIGVFDRFATRPNWWIYYPPPAEDSGSLTAPIRHRYGLDNSLSKSA